MSKATATLRALTRADRLVPMAGVYDALSACLLERAGCVFRLALTQQRKSQIEIGGSELRRGGNRAAEILFCFGGVALVHSCGAAAHGLHGLFVLCRKG